MTIKVGESTTPFESVRMAWRFGDSYRTGVQRVTAYEMGYGL